MLISVINIGVYDTSKPYNEQSNEIKEYIQTKISYNVDLVENESGAYWNVNDRIKRKIHNDFVKGVRVVELYSFPYAIFESNCIEGCIIDYNIEIL